MNDKKMVYFVLLNDQRFGRYVPGCFEGSLFDKIGTVVSIEKINSKGDVIHQKGVLAKILGKMEL